MLTLQVLQDVQTRLERGGRREEEEGHIESTEGGREKCARIETTMSQHVAVHHHKENSMNHSY